MIVLTRVNARPQVAEYATVGRKRARKWLSIIMRIKYIAVNTVMIMTTYLIQLTTLKSYHVCQEYNNKLNTKANVMMSVTSKKYNRCESWDDVNEKENADADPSDSEANIVNSPVKMIFTGQSWYNSAKQANKVNMTMDEITTRYRNHALNFIHSFSMLWNWFKGENMQMIVCEKNYDFFARSILLVTHSTH